MLEVGVPRSPNCPSRPASIAIPTGRNNAIHRVDAHMSSSTRNFSWMETVPQSPHATLRISTSITCNTRKVRSYLSDGTDTDSSPPLQLSVRQGSWVINVLRYLHFSYLFLRYEYRTVPSQAYLTWTVSTAARLLRISATLLHLRTFITGQDLSRVDQLFPSSLP
ncbi:uncharacterized protein CLUP02_00392 [Colletotrichum lupini]|uniref:Uncharacterized protein n=1 Tax=Colletotrichum lupini TaxID=145971 RepID=A0A9Q8W896_9PEZI|nr:uncharacterized protein CLUP02_00392 [Colletotrichum lupini]UQC73746.1 hypothetical protein CLUP02_00392 [Colletotrichum lupini]